MSAGSRRGVRLTACADIAALMLRGRRLRLERLVQDLITKKRLSRRFLEEVMIHLSLVLGFPHMLQGLEVISGLASAPRGVALENTGQKNLRRKGSRTFSRVYGAQSARVLRFLEALVPGMSGWILDNVYGRVYARPGLTLAEREVLTLVALNAHGHTKQLVGHLRGALRSGLSSKELRSILRRIDSRHGMAVGRAMVILDQLERGSSKRTTRKSAKKRAT